MSEPERIGNLTKATMEIIKRRCEQAAKAKPRSYACSICEDEGLVWVRKRAAGPVPYNYFGAMRCRCNRQMMGWYVTAEDRAADKSKRTGGPRKWDRDIPSYVEAGLADDAVYSTSARAAYEEQEHAYRKAADDPAARAEREAIKEECDHD